MATYRDLIAGALRLIGVIGDSETPSPYQADNALFTLTEMLDSWNADGLMIFTATFSELSLSTQSASWTIGPGAQIDVPVRPAELDGAWIRQNASTSSPIDIPMSVLTASEWGDIRSKSVSSNIPRFVFITGDWPVATLQLWPVPQVNDTKLILLFNTPLDNALTLDTTENLPPAYRQAIRFNLATLLAPEYGMEASPTVQMQAYKSKNVLTQNNQNIDRLDFDTIIQGTKQGLWYIGDDTSR
jgi:hypothetical protein